MIYEQQSSPIDDNILLDRESEPSSSPKPEADNSWKIMVIDDDKYVHQMTKLVLKDFTYQGKPITIISGYGGKDVSTLMEQHPDTAVILLDVVMESSDAGLKAVEYIRNTLKNKFVRIILRTGQPGFAPENEILATYDINDYKEKTELTTIKLYNVIIIALRSYQDLKKIQKLAMSNDTLEQLVKERTAELATANTGSSAKSSQ